MQAQSVCNIGEHKYRGTQCEPQIRLLIWIYTVCQRRFKNISAGDESRRPAVIGALRVYKCEFTVYTASIITKEAAQTTY